MVLMLLQFHMWCFKTDFEYINTPWPTIATPPTPPPTILTKQPCGTWRWNAGHDDVWGCHAGKCTLRSPKSGVKVPLLSLISYGNNAFHSPQHLLSSQSRSSGSGPPVAVISHPGWFCSHCCYNECQFHFARNHLISNGCSLQTCWGLFFNVVQQSDSYNRLTLEEVSFLLPIFLDEDVFINLSKWSANRVGIAQLTQCCVFSRSSLCEAHLGTAEPPPSWHPGKENKWASHRAPSPWLVEPWRLEHLWGLEDASPDSPVSLHPPC